jgi:hypothetical protein
MTFVRNHRVIAALVATSSLALTASASADPLPSTFRSDAAQAGYAGTPTASASTDPLPSTFRSDAAQAAYAGRRSTTPAPAQPRPRRRRSRSSDPSARSCARWTSPCH